MIFPVALLISQFLAVPIEEIRHHVELVNRNGVDLPFYYPESTSHSV
jgi:hypothetical protein